MKKEYQPAIIGGIVFALLGAFTSDASALPALLMLVALVQGLFALSAASYLAEGKWILPARHVILKLYPLLFVLPFAFLAFSRDLSIYGWMEHQTRWLSSGFFITRNVVMLFITAWLGYAFAKGVETKSEKAPMWAVLYAFAFVINQSLVAFDWVMSFDYPWISTLFGGYFFIEAIFGAIAVISFLGMRLMASGRAERDKTFVDTSTLMFGWSLLWAGQLFAQFLVIWYGNIPEEQLFLVKRLVDTPYRQMAIAVPFCLFFIPFPVLLSRTVKASNRAMTFLASLVLFGILLERLLFILPVAPMNPIFVVIGLLALLGPLAVMLWMESREAEQQE